MEKTKEKLNWGFFIKKNKYTQEEHSKKCSLTCTSAKADGGYIFLFLQQTELME